MTLHYSRRKYGSLGGQAPCAYSAAADRSSFDFDPSRDLRKEAGDDEEDEEHEGGRRWFTLVVVGVLAVVFMMGLTRAGYRLPKVTRERDGESSGGGENSLMEVTGAGAVRPKAKTTTTPAVQLPRPFPKGPASSTPSTAAAEDPPALSFTALNFYHVRDGKPAADYPWLKDVKLIEPYRDTTLAVASPRGGFGYRWKVYGAGEGAEDLRAEASGAEVVIALSKLDEHRVVLEEVDEATGKVARRLEEMVMVKYVRREIRTLTDDEREELLDAMYTLWTVKVDGGEGRELYGEDYADIFAINRLHYKAASPKECDHFHDGLGFLTNHAVISNTFEYSLQKVNPKLTLPYWDFTIETSSTGAAYGASSQQSQTNTMIFTENWFGSVDHADDMVKDGRWAYTEIPQMRPNNPGRLEADVYSKLRAPWNVNDRPYLTRGMGKMCGANIDESFPWPTCSMHYDMVTAYSDFYSWVWYSLYDPHGPVHIWIGGVLDCEQTYAEIASLVGPDIAEELALYSFIHRKNLFREGMFSCTETASEEEKPEELLGSGVCGCQGYDLTQGDDYEQIFDRMAEMSDLLGDFDADVKRQVVAALCTTPMNDGDHLQASSSMDPSFYALHPTMERLWMYAVLTGQIVDYTWPDTDITISKPDGSLVSESISLYGDTCQGHRGNDMFPFGLLESDTDGFQVRTGIKGMESGNTLTNRELLQAFDPRSNSLSYVYDTFKWTHCQNDGFNFDDAWKTQASTAGHRRAQFKEGMVRAPMYGVFEKMRAARHAKKTLS